MRAAFDAKFLGLLKQRRLAVACLPERRGLARNILRLPGKLTAFPCVPLLLGRRFAILVRGKSLARLFWKIALAGLSAFPAGLCPPIFLGPFRQGIIRRFGPLIAATLFLYSCAAIWAFRADHCPESPPLSPAVTSDFTFSQSFGSVFLAVFPIAISLLRTTCKAASVKGVPGFKEA
jgi:hypothetical protein